MSIDHPSISREGCSTWCYQSQSAMTKAAPVSGKESRESTPSISRSKYCHEYVRGSGFLVDSQGSPSFVGYITEARQNISQKNTETPTYIYVTTVNHSCSHDLGKNIVHLLDQTYGVTVFHHFFPLNLSRQMQDVAGERTKPLTQDAKTVLRREKD